MLKDAIRHDRGITCQACHGKSPGGTYAAGDNPLRFPKADLCGKCHNNETVLFEDYRDHGEIVRHPQKQMLAGVEGGQVPAQTYGSSLHATILAPNKCVSCHYNENAGGHTFEPEVSDCTGCQGPISTFNFPASKDYDNDGTTEGIQDEVHGLLDVMRTAVLAETPSTADRLRQRPRDRDHRHHGEAQRESHGHAVQELQLGHEQLEQAVRRRCW